MTRAYLCVSLLTIFIILSFEAFPQMHWLQNFVLKVPFCEKCINLGIDACERMFSKEVLIKSGILQPLPAKFVFKRNFKFENAGFFIRHFLKKLA